MKLQPTCSICLSKIKIIDLRIGSRRMGPGRKLLCKHVFHASCIDGIYKPQCPLCQHPIFNTDEEALLTCATEEAAIDILKNLHERDINVKNVFTFLTTPSSINSVDKYKWIVDLMYKYCDFTELLADNLNDKVLVKEIVARGKVNWFKTFYGGLTFFDLVYERTDDPEIIALVHERLPHQSKPEIITVLRPTSTRPTTESVVPDQQPLVPPRTYQRPRRMDSMSGATIEHQLWGTSGPLRPERTATVRRSLRGPRSKDQYEQPYPSAPPIELMI